MCVIKPLTKSMTDVLNTLLLLPLNPTVPPDPNTFLCTDEYGVVYTFDGLPLTLTVEM